MLVFLHGLPRWVPFTAVLGLLLAGAVLPGALAAACLAVVALFFGWLLFLSWPLLETGPRVLRGAVVAILVAAAGARVSGW